MTKEIIKAELTPTKINGNTGEIIETKPDIHEIAGHLKTYMDSKEKKIMFNGKRYAEFDDWQMIAMEYGLKIRTFDATFIEMGGRKGFKAKASVLDEKQNEVGRAESFCMDDEPNWRSKPLFQLASMAQTRAGAKALSNLFRPIARISGYEGTPAEELTADDFKEKPKAIEFNAPPPEAIQEEDMSDEVASLPPPDEIANYGPEEVQQAAQNYKKPYMAPVKKPGTISDKQRKLLWAKRKAANVPDAAWKSFTKGFGVEHDEDIDWKRMDECIKWIDRYQSL
jgi:hypothetical protein